MGKTLDDINHEARERKIAEARAALNTHNLADDEKMVLTAYLSALETVSHGVDSAHERITLRKEEHEEVMGSLHDMAESQALTCKAIAKIEKNQKEELKTMNNRMENMDRRLEEQHRQYRKSNIIGYIMSGATIFMSILIILGGSEALSMLSGLSNIFKVAQLVV